MMRMHDTAKGREEYIHALSSHGVDAANLAKIVERVEADVKASVQRVLVLGGGPMGLLAAIELSLLGHKVTIKEARDDMKRLNILRLWPETAMALAKSYALEKIDNGILWGATKPTASTTRLQLALLKVALIVGVRIDLDPAATKPPEAGGFSIDTHAREFDTLIVATGHRPNLLKTLRAQVGGSDGQAASEGGDAAPFAVGEKGNSTATALVAHFEVTDRNESAAKYCKEMPHTFDCAPQLVSTAWARSMGSRVAFACCYAHPMPLADRPMVRIGSLHLIGTVNDAITFDSNDAATKKRALERFGAAERLCCAIGPKAVAASLAQTYEAAAGGGALLENVLMYANKEKSKRVPSGKMELPNLTGVPPSYYFIMTLKESFVRELVVRMAKRTREEGGGGSGANGGGGAQPAAVVPAAAKEALEWAMAQIATEGGAVTRAAFDAETSLAASTIAGVFTQPLGAAKKLTAFPSACRLLREVPTEKAYAEGTWRASTDVFDFTVSRHMKAAAEVVRTVNGQPRVQEAGGGGGAREQPLLVLHVGDALQEPFWPEGLGINRGMHNTFDACWTCNKWLAARGKAADVSTLLKERQQLYQSFTMPMSGKTRRMLLGFNNMNEPTAALTKVYQKATLDPNTRYNAQAFGFKDLCFPEWVTACRRHTKYDK